MHSKTHATNMKSLAGLTYHASVITNKHETKRLNSVLKTKQ